MVSCLIYVILQVVHFRGSVIFFFRRTMINQMHAIYQLSNTQHIHQLLISIYQSTTDLHILPPSIIKYNKLSIHCYNKPFLIPDQSQSPHTPFLYPFLPILPILPIDRPSKKSREGLLIRPKDKGRQKTKKQNKKEEKDESSYLGKGGNRLRPHSRRPVILLLHINSPIF